MAIINVQHNCREAKCNVTMCHFKKLERKISTIRVCGIIHNITNSFILNSGAQYNSELHRSIANVGFRPVAPAEWDTAVDEGLEEWHKKKMDL